MGKNNISTIGKLILKHRGDYDYFLLSRTENSEAVQASLIPDDEFEQKLSKQNCDKIFEVVDVEKLAKEESYKAFSQTVWINGFKAGFNKAMELNKDKVFTLGDVSTILVDLLNDISNWKYRGTSTDIINQILEKIQQPTEIEVEIEMENKEYILTQNGEGFEDQLYRTWETVPKLDSKGCLILRKL
jgi:hypothetical protein